MSCEHLLEFWFMALFVLFFKGDNFRPGMKISLNFTLDIFIRVI